jgi:phage tail sheath protein FI
VRRLILFLEESLQQGLQWAVLERNDEELRSRICSDVQEFLWRLWREGAFPGTKADEAFFVRCDDTTTSPEERAEGRLVCLVGVAPIRPREFVIVRIPFVTADATP